jgi:hypothetical protein
LLTACLVVRFAGIVVTTGCLVSLHQQLTVRISSGVPDEGFLLRGTEGSNSPPSTGESIDRQRVAPTAFGTSRRERSTRSRARFRWGSPPPQINRTAM